jgi:hypothetical protein
METAISGSAERHYLTMGIEIPYIPVNVFEHKHIIILPRYKDIKFGVFKVVSR